MVSRDGRETFAMMPSLPETVQTQLTRSGSFPDLVSRCLGAWPPRVLEELLDLSRSGSPLAWRAGFIARDAGRARCRTYRHHRGVLPEEHPLDGDWRFARHVPGRLVDRLIAAAGEDGRMLLLCVPTVVLEVARRGLIRRAIVGVRERDPVADALRRSAPGATYVPLHELAGAEASAGLVDPPWCEEVAAPIVKNLTSGVRRGATVLVTGPDHLTASTTAGFLRAGERSPRWPGLEAVGQPWRVRYRTPRFEARAMQASGVGNVPPHWRTGLVHAYARSHDAVAVACPVPDEDWEELAVGGYRIWIREKAATGQECHVQLCASVSRTAPLRAVASVWTSGNVVAMGGTRADLRSLREDVLEGTEGPLLTALLTAERRAVDIAAQASLSCLPNWSTV